MKNKKAWKPSKYVYRNGKLSASRDTSQVSVSSRLVADITANYYSDIIPIHAKGKLLDLGCGYVPLYHVYKHFVDDIICSDWINSQHENNHIDIECDLSKPLPFKDNEFDTIILSDVLEHVFKPHILWAEIYRILSPKGKLILNVPFYYWIHEQPNDYYRYTEFALKRFAEDAGFKIIDLKESGGSPEVLTELMTKHIQQIPLFGEYISTVIQLVVKKFISIKVGRKISEKTAKTIPLGYFMVVEK